jgi:hypothetical protein
MKFKGKESDLSLMYSKAKESFYECINNQDNEFLKNEISISIDNIIVIEKSIKIVYLKRIFDKHLIEVCLLLFEGNKEIGKYIYVANDKNEGVDDSLVFY